MAEAKVQEKEESALERCRVKEMRVERVKQRVKGGPAYIMY